ncbi:hypothetical protein BGZ75_010235 [Mortierella antarctica]|nr:hypothetical protein BGZ67_007377 [Mortierella alpina]KAF9987970.1 hypothetical protein BGZ75_010235 [Mortierella antarctica]
MDQDDCDGLTPEAQSLSSSATRGLSTEILTETMSALAMETARMSVKAEAAAAAAVRSSSSSTTGAYTPKSGPGKGGDMDLATMFIKYLIMKQATEGEGLALKREQFESMREDQVTKNTIEMQRIVLEARRLELEHQRMLEKQRLDADYRLAKLKCDTQYAIAELRQDTESRNGGRGRAPVDIPFSASL